MQIASNLDHKGLLREFPIPQTCLEQRYNVVCQKLALPVVNTPDRYNALVKDLKHSCASREQMFFVLHQLFLARLPTTSEIDQSVFRLSHETSDRIAAFFLNSKEFQSGRQRSTAFEPTPSKVLLVDVTDTLRLNYNSGIQRVVRSLTHQLALQSLSHRLIEFDTDRKIYRAVEETSAKRMTDWGTQNRADMNPFAKFASGCTKRFSKLAGRRLRKLTRKAQERVLSLRKQKPQIALGLETSSVPATTSALFVWENALLLPELQTERNYLDAILPFLVHARVHSTLIVFDMLPIRCPEYFTSSEGYVRYLSLFRWVDQISCISNAVEQHVRDYMRLVARSKPPATLDTHYLGGNFAPRRVATNPPAIESRANSADELPTVLCVGTIEVRKNHRRILQAMVAAQKNGSQFEGVFIGNAGWLSNDFLNELRCFQSRGFKLKLLRSVGEIELEEHYQKAAFTMYCSLEEGFGLPIVESVVRGVPCITSNRGSMKEVADQLGGCILVDPDSIEHMTESIQHLLTDRDALLKLSDEAKNASWTSWEEYAAGVYEYASSPPSKIPTIPANAA
ncbi:glycosyltransferase [Aureliella helgolandensis]|uniref:GDP-mannose-dependent alpha-(1-6)-phosphatidylinositol monomannoside mannosyltransferase n=1 Tax=Aureliella helgolandensis TaxID=2527968 RepID=A0A518G4F7_9BACT|nr:glycosyltransferase [Aureliella helgolandensis]QDV23481.1 GDP-mannose-dependent alpha-(1-6)-phosphatidylinositol monomannoside mannosyltransferase [Aureliella helgolandensis]